MEPLQSKSDALVCTEPTTSAAPPPPPPKPAAPSPPPVQAWTPADGACANAPSNQSRQPADLSCMIGDVGYYRARYDDFTQRHPGQKPPSYYLEYGEKYAQRFTRETATKLTPAGQRWLDRTFELLQSRMEFLRMTDLPAFEKLERDPEAFKQFAYDTHSDAYLDAGLSKLPASDLAIIGTTPDASDLLTPDGIKQGVVTGAAVLRDKVQEALP